MATRLRCLPLTVSALLLYFGGSNGATAEEASAAAVRVSVSAGLLSLDARDAPLDVVLHKVAKAGDFAVEIQGDLKCPVTWSLTEVPLEQGIRRLLARVPSVLIHDPAAGEGVGSLGRVIVWSGPRDGKTCVAVASGTTRQPTTKASSAPPLAGLGKDKKARFAALRQLAKKPGAQAVAELVWLLDNDPDAAIRRRAAAYLSKTRDNRAGQALLRALQDQDTAVRVRAVHGLGAWREEAIRPLVKVLTEDPEPMVRRTAAIMLGKSNSGEALAALQIAERDSHQSVRRAATRSIALLNKY